MERYRSVYATFKEEGLAACVNIVPQILSVYRWQGQVHTDDEAAFFAKTTADLAPGLTARIAQLHSYDTPCIVVLPLDGGHRPYLDWIDEQV